MPLIEGRVWRLEVKAGAGRSKLLVVQADTFRDACEQISLVYDNGCIIESCVKIDADGLIVPPAITQ